VAEGHCWVGMEGGAWLHGQLGVAEGHCWVGMEGGAWLHGQLGVAEGHCWVGMEGGALAAWSGNQPFLNTMGLGHNINIFETHMLLNTLGTICICATSF
jgi:hypothetical protein